MLKKIINKKLTKNLAENRIYVFLIIVLILMTIIAPGFSKGYNINSLIKAGLLYIVAGIGFTYVMIQGHFDLSLTSVINMGAVLVIGNFNYFYKLFGGKSAGTRSEILGWIVALIIAIGAGALLGLFNGLLVSKGKLHSFIVTLGTQITVAGFVYWYCNGNTLSAKASGFATVIDKNWFNINIPVIGALSIRSVVAIILVLVFEVILIKTVSGKNFLLVGSNREAAWQAGVNQEKYTTLAFVISGAMSATAGALFAISMATAVPNYGEKGMNPLMIVLAATIIGGTTMSGGKGSVLKTAVAAITLESIFNGLICLGYQFDAQILSAGILLSLVVLYEAYTVYTRNKVKGQRPALLKELDIAKK